MDCTGGSMLLLFWRTKYVKILKILFMGSLGAVVAWSISGHGRDGMDKLLGYLILFNSISFAVTLKRKKGSSAPEQRAPK